MLKKGKESVGIVKYDEEKFEKKLLNKIEGDNKLNNRYDEHLANVIIAMSIMMFAFVCNLVFSYFKPRRRETIIEDTGFLLGGSYLFSKLTEGPFSRLFKKLSQHFLPYYLLSPSMKQRRELEILYDKQKTSLSNDHKNAIDEAFSMWDVYERNLGDAASQKMTQRLKQLLSLPTQNIPPIIVSKIEKDINFLISTYSKDLQKLMLDFIKQLIITTHGSIKNVHSKIVESPFLCGPPGVGKTRFAKKALKILGIPYKIILMSNIKNEKIIGSGRTDPWETKYDLGIIYDFLLTSKYRDIVIIYDEVDKALDNKNEKFNFNSQKEFLLSWFLHTLESETTKAKSEVFDFDIDISRVHHILIGNKNIDLKKRTPVLTFDALTPKIKLRIAFRHFKKLLSKEDYTVENLKFVRDIACNDALPGVRVMKRVITAYAIHIMFNKETKLLDTGDFSIKEQYKKYNINGEKPEFKPFSGIEYRLNENKDNMFLLDYNKGKGKDICVKKEDVLEEDYNIAKTKFLNKFLN